jgi:hypothetical protein
MRTPGILLLRDLSGKQQFVTPLTFAMPIGFSKVTYLNRTEHQVKAR